jgi:UPF0755 protein
MTKKLKRRLLFSGAIVVLLLIIAGASAVIWYQVSLMPVEKCDGICPSQEFVVAEGEGASKIAANLEKQGLIKSAFAFKIYHSMFAGNKAMMPGTYQFAKDMDVKTIIQSLYEGVAAKVFRITFLPGETIAASKKKLIAVGYSEEDVEVAFAKKYSHKLLESKPAEATLEGYIWGDTYEFYQTATLDEVLTKVFDEMWNAVQKEGLVAKYQAEGYTLHQGITLASIVQRESTGDYESRRHVAQVFLTRLKRGIVLGSDAIIAYRADQINPNRNKNDMSYLNTIDCPWNSRRCAGLPPTPISTPSLAAMKAVADPTDTNDLYFLTGDDGKMYYATTEAGHNANIRNYCKELCKVL